MGFMWGLTLAGVVVLTTILMVLYLRKKDMGEKNRVFQWIKSWGMTIVGIILTLIYIIIYFLDKTQFSLPQLIIGIFMIAVGIFYIHKYKNQSPI